MPCSESLPLQYVYMVKLPSLYKASPCACCTSVAFLFLLFAFLKWSKPYLSRSQYGLWVQLLHTDASLTSVTMCFMKIVVHNESIWNSMQAFIFFNTEKEENRESSLFLLWGTTAKKVPGSNPVYLCSRFLLYVVCSVSGLWFPPTVRRHVRLSVLTLI